MANGNHTNAYATVKPYSKDIAQDLIDNDFKYRAEKRLQEDHDEEKAKANDEKVKELAKYRNQIKPYDTESPTANTVIINAIAKKQDQMLEWFKVANDISRSNEERMNAQAMLEEAKDYPTKLKLITDIKTKEFQDYKTRRDKGEIYAVPEYEDLFKNGFAGIQIGDDEQGNPALMFFDKNGDGIKDVEKFESFANINRPDPFMKRFNYDAMMDEGAKTMGSNEVITQQGYTTTESKKVMDDVAEQTATQIADNPEALASFARDFGYPNYNNLSDVDKGVLKARIKADLLARTDEKFKQTTDLKAQETARHNRAGEAQNAENERGRNRRAAEANKTRIKVANSKGSGKTETVNIDEIAVSGREKEGGGKKDPKGTLYFGMGKGGGLQFSPVPGEYHIIDKMGLDPDGNLIMKGRIEYKDNNGNPIKGKTTKVINLNSAKNEEEMTQYSTRFTKDEDENFNSTSELLNAVKDKIKGKNIVPVGGKGNGAKNSNQKTYKGLDDYGNPIFE